MLEEFLLEILLSVILMFNVGAYTLLWNKTEENKEKIEELEDSFQKTRKSLAQLWNRIFGHDEDETTGGHLQETERRFDQFEKSLEKISSQIDSIDRRRSEEHQEVSRKLYALIVALDEEESVDIEKSDFEFRGPKKTEDT